MKKVAIIFITIMLFLASGCARQKTDKINYTYQGENALWSAELKLNARIVKNKDDGNFSYESECDRTLTVTYKNELSDLASAKDFTIGYDSGVSSCRMSSPFDEFARSNNTFTLTNGGSNNAMEIPESVINVTIQIDDQTQTFDLKYVE